MLISEEAPKHSVFLCGPKREIEAILFDMDGVLVDSVPLHIKAWNSALKEYNLPPLDRNAYLAALGRTNLDMMAKYLDLHHTDLPLSSSKEIVAKKERLFRALIRNDAKTMPGVMDWLEFLRKKQIRCSVASSGEMANIVAVLESLRLSDYFTSILSGARLPAGKPDPMLFTLAAASLGVRPEKCLVVEDAPAGIQAAKAANMYCCALATTA